MRYGMSKIWSTIDQKPEVESEYPIDPPNDCQRLLSQRDVAIWQPTGKPRPPFSPAGVTIDNEDYFETASQEANANRIHKEPNDRLYRKL